MLFNLSLVSVLIFILIGCASIVSKSHWPVNIQSNPTGAKCSISKDSGIQIHSGETPMTVSLNSYKGFFSSAKYLVNCSKDGFKSSPYEISADINGWYFGNIVFGGLIGMLLVDPATGSMWKFGEDIMINLIKYSDG